MREVAVVVMMAPPLVVRGIRPLAPKPSPAADRPAPLQWMVRTVSNPDPTVRLRVDGTLTDQIIKRDAAIRFIDALLNPSRRW